MLINNGGLILLGFLLIGGTGSNPVSVGLYYEALCPGCKNFITTQLFETYQTLKNTKIMEVNMVPYGNAYENQTSPPFGPWNFYCQHGPRECYLNLIEVCIQGLLNFKFEKYLPILYCIENSEDLSNVQVRKCLKKSPLKFQHVVKCAKGSLGQKWMHENALKTEALNPPNNYVPWITINGNHTDQINNEAMSDLLGLVCKTYQGIKPRPCKKQLNSRKDFQRYSYKNLKDGRLSIIY